MFGAHITLKGIIGKTDDTLKYAKLDTWGEIKLRTWQGGLTSLAFCVRQQACFIGCGLLANAEIWKKTSYWGVKAVLRANASR